MRIPCWPACLLLAALTLATGCSSQPAAKRIILLTNGNSPFWDTARAGLNAAAKDLQLERDGFQAVLEVNDGTPQGQIDKLKQFASQRDIVAVGVSVIDAANVAVADEMKRLQDKGIHVVTIDSDVDRDKFRDARFAFIGTDNLAGGIELGTAARHLRPEGGQYVTFVGRTGAQNAIERVGGFKQGAGDKFEDLDNMADSIDHTRARENVNNAIVNHPGLNVLVGIWSYNAPAIVDVVRRLDRRQDFTIVTFDAEPGAIEYMESGFIDAMVVQNPFEMGYQGVRLMKALAQDDNATIEEMLPSNGEGDGGDIYDTGLKVVVPDEGSPLKPDMFGEKTEFLPLGDFKDWLGKYGLQGS
jgi:ribose transport system substrate-binding protein